MLAFQKPVEVVLTLFFATSSAAQRQTPFNRQAAYFQLIAMATVSGWAVWPATAI
jgi:hypothetical protein